MSDTHKSTHPNIYRTVRLRAVSYNPMFSSMDTAGDPLYIGRQTLFAVESGHLIPSVEIVTQMAKVYHAPELLAYHCARECPIGKARGFQATSGIQVEGTALQIMSLLSESGQYAKTLMEDAKDGIIDSAEKEDIDKIIDWINQLSHLKDELISAIERKGK